jgi:hypothetical protein
VGANANAAGEHRARAADAPMSRRLPYELIFSLIAVLAITGWYVYVSQRGLPRPGGLIGHSLGIVGFALMLCTETLYTLRKRLRSFTMGSMNTWLRLHIFTGIVGPYLVLLHSAGRFHGLAGVVTILTVAMVISGFVGRYIYTAAPRTLAGAEVGAQELEERLAGADRQLRALGLDLEQAAPALAAAAPKPGWQAVLARHLLQRRQQRRFRGALRLLHVDERADHARLEELLAERYRLQVQINRLIGARRLLALWHLFHLPLGGVLFALAFLHTGAALYYATFLK